MNRPIVGITGASGFVGAALAEYLAGNGFRIMAFARRIIPGFDHRHYDLEKPVPERLLDGIDILIHCAFANPGQNPAAGTINYEGTKQLLREAQRCGVRKTIFFSSVSAHHQALSEYGKSKLRTETLLGKSDVILQCSLIIGPGGLFGRMLNHALSFKIIPLLQKGSQPLQVIALQNVQESVLSIITHDHIGTFVLANRENFTYRQFFTTISKVYKKRFVFVPVSPGLIKLLTTLSTKLKINLPFNREQLYGLQALKMFDPSESLEKLNLVPMTLQEILLQLKSGSATKRPA